MNFPFRLSDDKEFDAVGFGTNAVDHLIQVPVYPVFNSKVRFSTYVRRAGGEVASTMAGLRRLGLGTSYIGRFGDDEAGEFGLRSLVDEGVDVAHAERVAGAETQAGFILIDEGSGERTVVWGRDNKLAYAENEAPQAAALSGKILHLTPHDTLECIRLAREARDSGVIVSADIDNLFDGIETLLPLVDIMIASSEFPHLVTGVADLRGALSEISSRFGCAVVGVTLGAEGSLILCGDTFFETRGFAVPGGCVDTTGAGDAFRTGFLYGVLTGQSVEFAAAAANGVAALKCRELGARSSLPDEKELLTLLN